MEETRFSTAVDGQTTEFSVQIPRPRVTVPHALAGRHALIVGINYAPEPTGIAPYTTGMAEHLAQHARTVTVLTGMPHYPNWRLDAKYRWLLQSWERSGTGDTLTVHRVRHYVPRTQSAVTRAAFEASFLLNALSTRAPHRPDLVIAVTPSLSGAIAGERLARRHGSPLLVIVQELAARAARQTGIRGGAAASGPAAAIERYALRRADHVAVVSEAFRTQLHEYGINDSKISVLPNWAHISPSNLSPVQAREALGWPAEPFTVVHTGNIGLKQDLGNLIEAARHCQAESGIRFVIVGDGSQRATIEARARGLANLAFVDPLDADSYPKALAAANLLVVNERPAVTDMSLPSKLTSYFSAGRPVIAAVADLGATAQELDRTIGAARRVAPGDPAALAAGVLALRDDPEACAEMAAAGKRYAGRRLQPETAEARLDALLSMCISLP